MQQKTYHLIKQAFFLILFFIVFVGCDFTRHHLYHDPHLKTKQDTYDQLTESVSWEKEPFTRAPPPVVKTPVFPKEFDCKVSLTLIEKVSIREALIMLGTQAGVNIIVAHNLTEDISLNIKNQDFGSTLDHLCESYRLRFKINNNCVLVEKDTPFVKTYTLPFLSGRRESQTQMKLATDIFSGAYKGTQSQIGATDNGSNSTLNSATVSDFWPEVQKNLLMILKSHMSDQTEHDLSIHEMGHMITVRTSEVVHKAIQNYLDHLQKTTSAQVLIEAKILEVELTQDFQSGINWEVFKAKFQLESTLGTASPPHPLQHNKGIIPDVLSFGFKGQHLQTFLNMLTRFGTVRTLSSPRLTVLNNQSAIMRVATNKVFFHTEYTREPGTPTTREIEHIYSQIQTVPVGFLMTVHPVVDTQLGRIILHLRPTMSKVSAEKRDPSRITARTNGADDSFVPEIQIREIDTVLSMASGESIVMGGLMEDRSENKKTGLPAPPLISGLFSGKNDRRTLSELVIFLRVSLIVDPTKDTVAPADRRFYKTFSQDPRGFYA